MKEHCLRVEITCDEELLPEGSGVLILIASSGDGHRWSANVETATKTPSCSDNHMRGKLIQNHALTMNFYIDNEGENFRFEPR